MSDCSKTKICDLCMTGGIRKDVLLAGCQYGGETRFKTATHSPEIFMGRIVRVEVVNAVGGIS